VTDVATWLKELGLERYEPAFRDNEITSAVLPKLTDADLKELGLPLGPRKLLLEAIASLPESLPAEPAPISTTVSREAERRQLTVLFVDLVGSTALAARLDPEDMGRVIRAYHETCAQVVERWDGHVAKYMGDGVLGYFGWPQAHEDEAERAVRAGLELVEAVGALDSPASAAGDGREKRQPLAARVGVATGLVMVGELTGEGAAKEQMVVGETPNLAARLQALAAPGSIVISQSTRRLVGGLFQLADLGPRRLKGFAEPLAAWRVEGEGHAEGRFEALHGEHLTPLVGREHELGILLERWAWAKDGEGQIMLLSGEPGIGKSRLIRSLIERLAGESHTRLRYYCSPHHTNSALHPVIEQLERASGLLVEDSAETRLDKLEAMLSEATENLVEAVPLIGALLSVAAESRYPPLRLTPEAQKLKTLEALLEQLAGLTERRPVLMVLEDAQWIDPTTSELFRMTIDRIQRLPVLLLITFRPEFAPPWTGHAHLTSLTLSRLGQRQGAQMVERLTGGKPLPGEVLHQILLKTDGVPLFLEELTKTVLESGMLRDAGDRYELAGSLSILAIPATLHDSLVARLDRLAPVKEVAQIGAVIGREFSYKLLAAVAPIPANRLGDALEQLVNSELVFCHGTPPGATYSFKHALVQDAAYQSLLKSKRQQLHARIAQVLEQSPDAEAAPEVLAQHLTDAGLAERAIPYWRRAGELAASRSANVEAIAHLSKGLELIGTLPDAPERLAEELALLLAVGGPLIATEGYAVAEVERTYSRAWALCDQLGRSAELFPVLRGLWNCYFVRGDFRRANELAEQLAGLAEEQEEPLRRALARRALGATKFVLGRFADATAALNEGIAIDDAMEAGDDHRAHLLLYTERPGVVCRLYSAWVLWFIGFPDRALERVDSGLALGQRLAHANSLAFAQNFAAVLHSFRREFDAALSRAEATIDLAGKHPLPQWLAEAIICRGFALVGLGQQIEGIAQLRTGLAAWNGTGCRLFDTQWLGFIAEAHVAAGQLQDALAALDRAGETAAATGERHYQAELYRLRGVVLAKTGKNAEAAAWLQQAIDTAQGQEAKSLELRAATSLARLCRDQGNRAQARDLLTPIYGWFTEGVDTADLKDAKALLDELR
jgi:class 3 adenylate cyclase/predicted ATPase